MNKIFLLLAGLVISLANLSSQISIECTENYTLTNTAFTEDITVNTSDSLLSAAIHTNNSVVVYYSGGAIFCLEGFEVELGTEFTAEIQACTDNNGTFPNLLAIPDTLAGPNFTMTLADETKEFYPGQPANTFGYNGMEYMGPTLIFNKGETVSFDITNNTANEDVTVHWHGFHIPAEWDGGPMSAFAPGDTWSPTFDVLENASMMWYHSHVHGQTAEQVGKGMAGLIIIRDEVEAQLNLPRTYGVDDIPIILQDKEFNAAGQIQNAPLGDTMLLNGTLAPYVECPAQVVRFRFLNASTERVYNIGFSDNRHFDQIATDGGLLEAPVNLNRVVVPPGSRAELLFDFTSEGAGNNLYLMSYSTEFPGVVAGSCNNGPGCGNGPLDGTDFQFMQINTVAQTADPITTVPSALTTINWLDEADVDTTRVKQLLGPANPGDPFTIDGGSFNMAVINDSIPLGNTEIWRFENLSNLGHPIHIHDVQFNILRVNGDPPAANETGWKDVVLVYPGDVIEVIAEFLDFADPMYTYMMHCHSLNHEDNGMMEQFLVLDPN